MATTVERAATGTSVSPNVRTLLGWALGVALLLAGFWLEVYAMNVDGYTLTSTAELQNEAYSGAIETFWQARGQRGSFTGERNLKLEYIKFVRPDREREKGAIVIVSGRTEAYLKYKELIFDLWNNDYSVYIHDHRGQGLSAREAKVADHPQKGYVEDFPDFVADLRTFVDQHVRPGQHRNHFLLAHSMGGAIASLYLEEEAAHPFRAAALSSPMHAIRGLFGWNGEIVTCKVARVFVAFGQATGYTVSGHDYQPKAFDDNEYTSSRTRYQRFLDEYGAKENEKIRLGSATHGWYARACGASRRARENAARIAVPVRLFQAGRDTIVHPLGHREFCTNFTKSHPEGCGGPGGGPIVIDGAKHELFIEDDDKRNRVLTAILKFFAEHQR
jgi:lysophospholipase